MLCPISSAQKFCEYGKYAGWPLESICQLFSRITYCIETLNLQVSSVVIGLSELVFLLLLLVMIMTTRL